MYNYILTSESSIGLAFLLLTTLTIYVQTLFWDHNTKKDSCNIEPISFIDTKIKTFWLFDKAPGNILLTNL